MNRTGRTHISLDELVQSRLWLPPLLQKQREMLGEGTHMALRHGRSTEFDQVRDYQPGDDARHIDWRASARTDVIQTRLFQRERERPVFIVTEQSPAMFFASRGNFKSVQAALLTSLFAWAAQESGDRIGGLIYGQESPRWLPPARKQQAVLHLLQQLSQANQQLDSPLPAATSSVRASLAEALQLCRHLLTPATLLIVICDEQQLTNTNRTQLGGLASHFDSIWLPVSDPLEHRLPARKNLLFSGYSGTLRIFRTQRQLRESWQQQARQRRSQWQQMAAEQRCLLRPVCTSNSLMEQPAVFQGVLHAIRA